jgi:hypothetical protein
MNKKTSLINWFIVTLYFFDHENIVLTEFKFFQNKDSS